MIIKNYTCAVCGKEYPPEQTLYTCPDDGGNLSVILDYAALSKKVSPKDIRSGNLNLALPGTPAVTTPGCNSHRCKGRIHANLSICATQQRIGA